MSAETIRSSQRRYRRRIVGWGATTVIGLGVTGAIVAVNQTEDELESRIDAVLVDHDVFGVTTHFAGQRGQLRCLDGPVAIPDDVLSAARDVRGVSSLEVARTCRMADRPNSSPTSDTNQD